MPQVAGGLVEPRHIRVSLPGRLPKTRFVLGTVRHVDPARKIVSWDGPEGASGQVGYDHLILSAGVSTSCCRSQAWPTMHMGSAA